MLAIADSTFFCVVVVGGVVGGGGGGGDNRSEGCTLFVTHNQ